MISIGEYQTIRRARPEDLDFIWKLVRPAMEKEELMQRSREELEQILKDFFILELDQHPVACAALHVYPEQKTGEVACLCVSPSHENRGLARALLRYLEEQARQQGLRKLIALSTQAYVYFQRKAGYEEGSLEDLPPSRRARYEQCRRRSKILVKPLT